MSALLDLALTALADSERHNGQTDPEAGKDGWWCVRYPDHVAEVAFWPLPAGKAEVLAHCPGAVDAEPSAHAPRKPAHCLAMGERMEVRRWLEEIGESNIEGALDEADLDADAREFYLGRARGGK